MRPYENRISSEYFINRSSHRPIVVGGSRISVVPLGYDSSPDERQSLTWQQVAPVAGGTLVLLAAIVTMFSGLYYILIVHRPDEAVTGTMFVILSLLSIGVSSFAIWRDELGIAAFSPVPLLFCAVGDYIATADAGIPLLLRPFLYDTLSCLPALILIGGGYEGFYDFMSDDLDEVLKRDAIMFDSRNPSESIIGFTRGLSVLGGIILVLVSIAGMAYGYSYLQVTDAEAINRMGQVFIGMSVVALVGGIAALVRVGLELAVLSPLPLMGCGIWDLSTKASHPSLSDVPGSVAIVFCLCAYIFIAFSWPGYELERKPQRRAKGKSAHVAYQPTTDSAGEVIQRGRPGKRAPAAAPYVRPIPPPRSLPTIPRPAPPPPPPAERPLYAYVPVEAPPILAASGASPPLETAMAGPPSAGASSEAIPPPPPDVPRQLEYLVEQVFLVYNDGRLIAHCSREECKTTDADLMSGMLIAIQGLIQDGLERGGRLESIKYGENLIMMTSGEYVTLAVVIYGKPDDDLKEVLEHIVSRIESSYAGVIEQWTGDMSVFSRVGDMVSHLIESTEHISRGDLKAFGAESGVALLSAVDFHRGYVRLKAALVNNTDEIVVDARMDLMYNSEMLHLERVEPVELKLKGDRVTLGNLRPRERVTVAFLFDPQICQSTYIDGTLSYYDFKGGLHRIEMKRRHADVVCPIFFTRENANTAMLKRLVRDELYAKDMRVFRYPKGLRPPQAMKIAKLAIAGEGVQLVREYVVEGPPYEAEAWFYGETKVKAYRIVMCIAVIEEKQLLEFMVASTVMEPITGILADFRRSLNDVLERRYVGKLTMALERDEVVRGDLERRPMLLDRVEEGEIEAGEVA